MVLRKLLTHHPQTTISKCMEKNKYSVKINKHEPIQVCSLHKQVNGLKRVGTRSYAGECLLLKFSKSGEWLDYYLFDPKTNKEQSWNCVSTTPENNLIWLYYLLKEDAGYKYCGSIFPESIFN